MTIAALLVAGAVGSWARYEVAGWVQRRSRSGRPLGTVVVNLGGTLALALLVVAEAAGAVSDRWVVVVGTGFLGAFTTFSTWMVESVHLGREGGGGGVRAGILNIADQLVAGSLVAYLLLALA